MRTAGFALLILCGEVMADRFLPGRVVRYWLAVAAVGLLFKLKFYDAVPELLQAGLFLAVLLWLARQRPLTDRLTQLPVSYQRGLVGVLALMIVVQLAHASNKAFPVVCWCMYSQRKGYPVTWYEYQAVLADGREVPLAAGHGLFPALTTRVARLPELVEHMENTTDPRQLARHRREYRQAIVTQARRYEQQHGGRVVRVRVIRCRWPLDALHDERAVQHEELPSVAVDR